MAGAGATSGSAQPRSHARQSSFGHPRSPLCPSSFGHPPRSSPRPPRPTIPARPRPDDGALHVFGPGAFVIIGRSDRIARNEASCIHPSPIRNARRPIACRARARRTSRQRTRREKVHGLAIRRLSVMHDARLRAALKRAEPLGAPKRRGSAPSLAHSSKLRVVSPSDSEYGRIGGMGKGRSGDKGQGDRDRLPANGGAGRAWARDGICLADRRARDRKP